MNATEKQIGYIQILVEKIQTQLQIELGRWQVSERTLFYALFWQTASNAMDTSSLSKSDASEIINWLKSDGAEMKSETIREFVGEYASALSDFAYTVRFGTDFMEYITGFGENLVAFMQEHGENLASNYGKTLTDLFGYAEGQELIEEINQYVINSKNSNAVTEFYYNDEEWIGGEPQIIKVGELESEYNEFLTTFPSESDYMEYDKWVGGWYLIDADVIADGNHIYTGDNMRHQLDYALKHSYIDPAIEGFIKSELEKYDDRFTDAKR